MIKKYKVSFRGPTIEDEKIIACTDFQHLGTTILEALFPPPECPTVITKIELIDPEQYLHGDQE